MFNLKGLNRAKITNVNILLASVTATFLFSMYAASAVYIGTSTTSETTNSTSANVEYPEDTIQSVSITTVDDIHMHIDTTSNGAVAYGQGNIMVASNAAGYSILISSNSDDTSLHLNGDVNSASLPSTTTNKTILEDTDMNSWSFTYGEKDERYREGHPETLLYEKIPPLSSPKDFIFGNQNTALYTVYFGARANRTAQSGEYSGEVIYSVVAWGETQKDFSYTGGEQSFLVPYSGKYKLETWGAQGGTLSSRLVGGYGAYSVGYADLNENDILYINIGGAGTNCVVGTSNRAGGYNGGGTGTGGRSDSWSGCGGGGATHIAFKSGILSSLSGDMGTIPEGWSTYNSDTVLIVSGAGGGAGCESYAGNAGGLSGGGGVSGRPGGTQTTGCRFGLGCNGATRTKSWGNGGGGGGWYGGYGGTNGSYGGSGGGGSSYIGSSLLKSSKTEEKHMTCYSCTQSSDYSTRTYSTTNISGNAVSDYAKTGNGFARITFIGGDNIKLK